MMQQFTYKIGAQGAQDRAKQFMANDIVRGIVELITNSDAAYTALGLKQPKLRSIAISVNTSARWYEVRDRAGGMSPAIVNEKFTEGGATSAEGQRGYFGLGAKDCAVFGSLTLKTIDKNGAFTEVLIPGDFENCRWGSRQATERDYEEIHGTARKQAGTVVRINVDKLQQGGARINRFNNLVKELRTHYALRRLHQRNRVTIRTIAKAPEVQEKLVYPGFPWETPRAECVYDDVLQVKGYPDSQPMLRLFKLPESVEGEPSSEIFEGFILIGTKDVVDYGFTLAGLEKRDHSKQLVGDLDDVYIQTLLIDYRRNGPSKQNPRPVVSQDRRPRNGGLDPDHPYTKGLFATLQPILSDALEQLQAQSRGRERSGISEALQSANEEAGRRLSQILDAEGETPTPKPLLGGFYFLPGSKALKQGRTDWESLSLYSIPEGFDEDSNDAEVYLKLEDNICALESRVVRLHERFGDNLGRRVSIRLQAGDMIGRTTLSASLNGRTAEAIVSVVDIATPPMLVQFERSKYSVQPSRRRTVRVLVPESLIDDTSDGGVRLSSSDSGDGVVIRGPSSRTVYDCGFDKDRVAYVVPFQLEGRRIGTKVKLTATFQGHHAEAELTVGGGSLRILLDDNETSPPDERAKVYDIGDPCSSREHENELCLHVFARHPRLEPYLGEPRETPSGIFWNLNDSPGFRAMYADCVAEAVAQFQILGSGAHDSGTSDDAFASFWVTKKKALAVMQRIYIDSERWKSQEKLLDFVK